MVDTHSHIYSEEFDSDLTDVIQRSKAVGIQHIILPNVDSSTLSRMLSVENTFPDFCSAAIGLHPTSVNENYLSELAIVKAELSRRSYIAVGEIGIDLYWDKTFLKEQILAFQQQVEWALEYNLPVIIHIRNSFTETMNALKPYQNKGLKGIFHSFTGTLNEAAEMINFGNFKLGINGIVTFKNSGLADVVSKINVQHIVLETDSPYLSPVPHRGKRNESAYIKLVCEKLSEIYNLPFEQVESITTSNAKSVFNI